MTAVPYLTLVASNPADDPRQPPTDAQLAHQYARASARLWRAEDEVRALVKVMSARAKVAKAADPSAPKKRGRPRAYFPTTSA